jgi:hypothetical protein
MYNNFRRPPQNNNFNGGFILPFAAGLLAAPLIYRPYPYRYPYQYPIYNTYPIYY